MQPQKYEKKKCIFIKKFNFQWFLLIFIETIFETIIHFSFTLSTLHRRFNYGFIYFINYRLIGVDILQLLHLEQIPTKPYFTCSFAEHVTAKSLGSNPTKIVRDRHRILYMLVGCTQAYYVEDEKLPTIWCVWSSLQVMTRWLCIFLISNQFSTSSE